MNCLLENGPPGQRTVRAHFITIIGAATAATARAGRTQVVAVNKFSMGRRRAACKLCLLNRSCC
jgi:hypothetical protein